MTQRDPKQAAGAFGHRLEALLETASPGPWHGGGHTQIWSSGIPKGHWSDANSDDEPPMGHVASVKNADGERGDEIRRQETESNAQLIVFLRNLANEIAWVVEAADRLTRTNEGRNDEDTYNEFVAARGTLVLAVAALNRKAANAR